MDKVEFEKEVKNILYGRIVADYEIYNYLGLLKYYKLQPEYILIAIQFARMIKGPAVHFNYILSIIKNWLNKNLHNPGMLKKMLLEKNVIYQSVSKPKITKSYNKEFYENLFDSINDINKL